MLLWMGPPNHNSMAKGASDIILYDGDSPNKPFLDSTLLDGSSIKWNLVNHTIINQPLDYYVIKVYRSIFIQNVPTTARFASIYRSPILFNWVQYVPLMHNSTSTSMKWCANDLVVEKMYNLPLLESVM